MKKVLVIDADEDILNVVRIVLTTNGIDVHTETTARNVRKVVNYYHPNVILLGMRLAGKLGSAVCRELKKHFAIPIILLSTVNQEKIFKEFLADDYIQQPFDIKNLLRKIKLQLKRYNSHPAERLALT